MAREDQREHGPLTVCKCGGDHNDCTLMNNYAAENSECPFCRKLLRDLHQCIKGQFDK